MAIYHLNARGCSPSTGAGAVRKAAYQSGQALVEERSGELCDYARKERVTAEGLALPLQDGPGDAGQIGRGTQDFKKQVHRPLQSGIEALPADGFRGGQDSTPRPVKAGP